MAKKKFLSTNEAWKKLIEEHDILDEVSKNGYYEIKTDDIKVYREPRLMAKWDSSESLPAVLKKNKLNLLPNTRSSYIISNFLLYEDIPELEEQVKNMKSVAIPDFETIDANNITTETQAINVLIISGILDDFLNTPKNTETFNGRMGVGKFNYIVDTSNGTKMQIDVDGVMCEIDGGFENNDSVVILEAKNVVHPDFHIRQLYYPYRLWKSKINKPIRLVFSVYSNMIYRLYEYVFEDDNDYSSIKLVNAKSYSLDKTKISLNDLKKVRENTGVETDDNQENTNIPFPQADSFERIISLLENIYNNPLTTEEIAELMQFRKRQSDYYFNAGKYLGLFEKKRKNDIRICLTETGEDIMKMNYKKRQLTLVEQLLKHQIFADLFDYKIKNNKFAEKDYVINLMKKYNVCNKGELMNRRASTVMGWVRWVFNLIIL